MESVARTGSAEASVRRGLRLGSAPLPRLAFLAAVAASALACGERPAVAAPRPLDTPPPTLELALEELGCYGDGDGDGGALLERPVGVRTDAAGNVYVADALARRVLVFDRDGGLVRRVGGDGRGAGGLLAVHALHVFADGSVLVADGNLQRVTRFDPSGRALEVHALDPDRVLWPREITALPEGDLLLAFRLPRRPSRLPWRRPRPLLHRFDAAFDDEIEAFAEPADGGAEEGLVEDLSSQIHPGSLWVAADGDVLWAPRLYHGRIVRFSCGDGRCEDGVALAGWLPAAPAWRQVPTAGRVPGEVDLLSTVAGGVAAIFRHESRGLFELRDGGIAHFTLTAAGGERRFGVERFDGDGRLLGYAVLDRVPLEEDRSSPLALEVAWKDADDAFYLVDRTGEAVVVRRARLVERVATAEGSPRRAAPR